MARFGSMDECFVVMAGKKESAGCFVLKPGKQYIGQGNGKIEIRLPEIGLQQCQQAVQQECMIVEISIQMCFIVFESCQQTVILSQSVADEIQRSHG